jgi:AcrR family transcriptional regulator
MVPVLRATSPASSRQATEDVLLDALESVLLRDGLRNLSVNAVIEAAGVGKPLLYRYFGDLSGLVRAWGERRGLWADLAAQGEPPSRHAIDDRAFREQVTDELVGVAEYLRHHPVSVEFLAEELSANTDFSEAFAAARADSRRPFLRTMLADPRYLRRDNRRLIVVLYAAVVYLSMRAARSPACMGLRLDTEAGWNDAMAMVRELAELALPADNASPTPSRS